MAVMGLRLAGRSNAVAKLHGEVSREMFSDLWPDVPAEETPITSVTNGVHADTWVAPEMADLLTRHVLPDWQRGRRPSAGSAWRKRATTSCGGPASRAASAWSPSSASASATQLMARGLSSSDVEWTDSVLDPKALTIGFARRFATYKRATLLLSQPDRLKALLLSADRPVQFVFAGKAHPADDSGKELIRQVQRLRRRPRGPPPLRVRRRLRHRRRPRAAPGLRRVAQHPAPPAGGVRHERHEGGAERRAQLSILDGWWDEAFDGENGWAITSAEHVEDLERRDEVEAGSLFELLERQVVPLFYERWQGPVPRRWVQRVKRSLITLGPFVSAARMVRDYTEQLYEPTAAQGDLLSTDDHKRARSLAAWKQTIAAGWSKVHVDHVELDSAVADLGAERSVEAVVSLGDLSPADVQVQLIHGPSGQGQELASTAVVSMLPAGTAADGHLRYTGTFTCTQAGRYGVTIRVVPAHEDLVVPAELGRIAWA